MRALWPAPMTTTSTLRSDSAMCSSPGSRWERPTVSPGREGQVASRHSPAWRPGRDDTTARRETDVLGSHELVQGLGRLLSSEAAALHAAEGRADEGTPGVVVDEHHADLEAPGE